MNIKSILALFLTVSLAVSCSGDVKNRSSKEYLSAYLKDNKSAVIFGKLDIKSILEKADYKSNSKVNALLSPEIKAYESAIDLKEGIHFAMEGPFEDDGTPANVIAFVKVLSPDSLSSKISSQGLMLQEDGDMKFVQDNDVSIGIKDNLAIFITKKGPYDGKANLKEIFKKCENDLSDGKVAEILDQKGDILMGVNLENLHGSSNTSLSNLPAAKQKELKALVKDSYIKSAVSFETGQAVFTSQNLFSDQLMKRMFFEEDEQAKILEKLGTGNARMGFALNCNILKIENFLEDFSPDYKRGLGKMNFQVQMAMSTMGDKPLTNFWNGKLGLVMVGDMFNDGSMVPEFNFHFGFGNKGKDLSEIVKAFFPSKDAGSGGFVSSNGLKIKIDENEVTGYSEKAAQGYTSLKVPGFATNFTKKGVTGFFNFDGLDIESMGFDGGAKAFYAFENIWFDADNSGSRIVIKAKKSTENILKQVADIYIRDLEKTLMGI